MKNSLGGFIYEKKIEKKIFLPGIRIHFNGIPHGNWHNFQFSVQESGFVFVQLQTKVRLCWLKVNPWEVETKGALLKEAGSPNIPAWSLFLLDPCEQRFQGWNQGNGSRSCFALLGAAEGIWMSLWAVGHWVLENKEAFWSQNFKRFWVLGLPLPFRWEVMEAQLFKFGLWEGESGLSKAFLMQ